MRDEVYRSMSQEMVAANRGAVSAKGFELSARRIGRLMRDQFNLGFVDVGGWDTHVNQGGATGYLAGRLGELGRGLAGYVAGDRARRPGTTPSWSWSPSSAAPSARTATSGTDHGHGSVYWVMGGAVKGGRIAGEQVAVDQARCSRTATIRC